MKSKNFYSTVLFVTLLVLMNDAHAVFQSNSNTFEFKFLAGASIQYGTNSLDGEDSSSEKNMAVYGIDSVLALRWKFLLLGAGIDYSKWKQLTDPEEVGNVNNEGTMINKSLVTGFGLSNIALILKYHLNSEYEFSKENSSGDKLTLLDPESPFTLQLLWRRTANTYLGLVYTNLTYKKEEVNGSENLLKSTAKQKFSAIGLTYGLTF